MYTQADFGGGSDQRVIALRPGWNSDHSSARNTVKTHAISVKVHGTLSAKLHGTRTS